MSLDRPSWEFRYHEWPCANCGGRAGAHASRTDACPTDDPDNRWSETSYLELGPRRATAEDTYETLRQAD